MSTLLDQTLRHEVYFEGLKLGEVSRINRKMLQQLERGIQAELKKLQFDRLDSLTAKGREAVLKRIKDRQAKILEEWQSELMKSMRGYAKADSSLFSRIISKFVKTKKPPIADLWASVVKDRVAGVNGTMNKMFRTMANAQIKAVQTKFRQAHAEGLTRDEFMSSIKGSKEKGYSDGLFRKFRNQARAVGFTAFQHTKGRVHEAVAETSFTRYRWVSVLDTATTHICRGRNGKIFRYGNGPIPPAHYHCRSSTVPIAEEIDEPDDLKIPYFDWVQEQPEEFIRDIYNKSDAEKLIKGTAKRKDFDHFDGIGPLSLNEFVSKLPIIQL